MYRVLIPEDVSQQGLQLLRDTPGIELVDKSSEKWTTASLRAALAEADAVIVRSKTKMTPELLDGQTRLKLIVRAGVGVDTIDLPSATRQGIIVMNTPAGNTTSTAEHSVAMLMGLSRHIGAAAQSMKEGKWDKKSFTGVQLAGKTIGVVGLGRIGLCVASRCKGLEMTVLGYDPFLSEERAGEYGVELYRNLDEMLIKCDFITVHTPLTDETRGLIGAERIARLKKGVRIINCARGGIVDEPALLAALDSGHVAGAALDVFVKEPPDADNLLPKHPKVLCTPHLGASTGEAQEQVAVEAAELVSAFLTRGEVRSAVNMASISGKEMEGLRPYLDLGYRLGMLLSQLAKGQPITKVALAYKGEVAQRPTKMVTNAFLTGMLRPAIDDVNVVNAEMVARDKGLHVQAASSLEAGPFTTLVSATITTPQGELTAAGTTFGNEFLRLVKLDGFQMDSFLDGLMLVYRHRDVPGLIGSIGTAFGSHGVNIFCMALGREMHRPGGDAVAILNLDNEPSPAALAEVSAHPDVTGVQLVRLPPAGASLPGLM